MTDIKGSAKATTTDVAIVTTTELAGQSVKAIGIKSGESLVIIANIHVISGADASAIRIRIRQGIGITGTVIGSVYEEDIQTATDDITMTCLFVAQAFQDDPEYVVTAAQLDATGNGTLSASAIYVNPVNG